MRETGEATKRERAEMRARKQAERDIAHDRLADAEQRAEREFELSRGVYRIHQPLSGASSKRN
jgi:hypothetical protein